MEAAFPALLVFLLPDNLCKSLNKTRYSVTHAQYMYGEIR